jgi:hypothetical protein
MCSFTAPTTYASLLTSSSDRCCPPTSIPPRASWLSPIGHRCLSSPFKAGSGSSAWPRCGHVAGDVRWCQRLPGKNGDVPRMRTAVGLDNCARRGPAFLAGRRHDDNRSARVISDLGGYRAKTQSREAKLATRIDNQHVSITRGVDKLLCREAVHGGHLHRGRLGVTKLVHHLRDGILAAVRACCSITASCGMTAGLPVQGLAATSLTARTVSVAC